MQGSSQPTVHDCSLCALNLLDREARHVERGCWREKSSLHKAADFCQGDEDHQSQEGIRICRKWTCSSHQERARVKPSLYRSQQTLVVWMRRRLLDRTARRQRCCFGLASPMSCPEGFQDDFSANSHSPTLRGISLRRAISGRGRAQPPLSRPKVRSVAPPATDGPMTVCLPHFTTTTSTSASTSIDCATNTGPWCHVQQVLPSCDGASSYSPGPWACASNHHLCQLTRAPWTPRFEHVVQPDMHLALPLTYIFACELDLCQFPAGFAPLSASGQPISPPILLPRTPPHMLLSVACRLSGCRVLLFSVRPAPLCLPA